MKQPVAIVPARALDDAALSLGALKLLCLLGTYANRHGLCWPSIRVLAGRLGTDKRDVYRRLAQLVTLGYVERLPGGGTAAARCRVLYSTSSGAIKAALEGMVQDTIPPVASDTTDGVPHHPQGGAGHHPPGGVAHHKTGGVGHQTELPNELPKEPNDGFYGVASAPPPTKRGTRLPVVWMPGIEAQRFAVDVLGETGTSDQLDRFCDYWHAASGPRAVKRDWDATWRNWVRKAADDERRKARGGSPSANERYERARNQFRDWALRADDRSRNE